MGTVKQTVLPRDADYPASNSPQFASVQGTNFPVDYLAFDASTEEACYFRLPAPNYGSGNITVRVHWNSAAQTSGDVKFGASVAAITPDTDSQDVETKAFAAESTTTDSHLGTTAKRIMAFTIAVSNLDSIAAGDDIWVKLARKAADAADTLTGDCRVLQVDVEYSDV